MHLPVGTLLQGGRYEIIRYISSGGFGCTYEARDTKFKSRVKSVAIKEFFVKDFCNRDADSNTVVVATNSKVELVNKLRVKFLEEADALFELEHPNIVRVTDTFEENGTAYYVMEYISGTTLAAIVDKEGSLSEEKALGYIRQVADALKYVHSHKRSHFDVKPQNIMVDSNDRAVLIDFGVSKQYDEVNGVNTSTLVGYTPGYAPMELTYNDIAEFSPTTDIYSLGATLFNLVTGTVPPSAGRVNEDGLPVPVDVSAQVFDAIKAAMQPRRKDRPQNIDEFLSLLSENGKVKTENGKNKEENDGETVLNGNVKGASKREGENLFTHTASESSFDEVKGENGKLVADEFNPIDVVEVPDSEDGNVISNESEKSQKNKPGKSLWLILLLLLVAVAGAWFLFSGTGNGNTPKTDTKNQIEKKDTPKEAGNTTDGNEASESSTGSGIDKEENVNGTAVVSNNNEEVKNFEKNSIRYNVTDKSKKTVEVAKGKYTGSIVIPETVVHNDVYYSVTSIGRSAFYGCTGLTSITIPNSVTSIGYRAFSGCDGLTSITIPNSVTSIGVSAFLGCSGLTSITIPNSVTSIGYRAFSFCSGLTSITIPNSVTSIGDRVFYGCTGLTSITIPNSVTSIGASAFDGCKGLTSIAIPNSVKSIGRYAFSGCTGLTSITIPNSVTSIGDYAFKDCDDLTNVIKPDGIRIGKDAFKGTPWLKKQK